MASPAPTSQARIEANRRNAQKSTGPKTEEGKARSRLNAFRHGLAGAGDLVAPHEEKREVDELAGDFARELGARGRVGAKFARRAAVMMHRLEKAEDRGRVAGAIRAQAARDEFDRERADELQGLVDLLDAGDDPRPVLDELEGSPEGVEHLLGAWETLRDGLRAGRDEGHARSWLGAGDEVERDELVRRAGAELDRLEALDRALGGTKAAIVEARRQAGLLAEFDETAEGERARRHEAVAERALHRACRAIADHRRTYEAERPGPAVGVVAPRLATAPPPIPAPLAARPEALRPLPAPAPATASFPPPAPAPLASFRVRDPLADMADPARRRNRPDPARLVAARR